MTDHKLVTGRDTVPTIRKRGNKWQAMVRRTSAAAISRSFSYRADAVSWAMERELEIERGDLQKLNKPTDRTIEQMLRNYLEVVTPKKRSASREQGLVQSLFAEPFARMPMARLEASELAAYRDRRLRTVMASTVRRQFAILYHAFRVAEDEWGWAIPRNLRKRIPLPNIPTKAVRRLRRAEEIRLIEEARRCSNPLIEKAIRLALLTGMRRGELLTAKWVDIDFDRRDWLVPETKTGHDRRIPLSDAVVAVLHSLSQRGDHIVPLTANALRLAFERVRKRGVFRTFGSTIFGMRP